MQIRAALAAAAASFLSGAGAVFNLWLFAFAEIALLLVYFTAAVFYIRPLARSVRVNIDSDRLLIFKGVIFIKNIVVPLKTVRYFELRCSLLSRALGVYSVIAHTSSGRVRISGLGAKSARIIVGAGCNKNENG